MVTIIRWLTYSKPRTDGRASQAQQDAAVFQIGRRKGSATKPPRTDTYCPSIRDTNIVESALGISESCLILISKSRIAWLTSGLRSVLATTHTQIITRHMHCLRTLPLV